MVKLHSKTVIKNRASKHLCPRVCGHLCPRGFGSLAPTHSVTCAHIRPTTGERGEGGGGGGMITTLFHEGEGGGEKE